MNQNISQYDEKYNEILTEYVSPKNINQSGTTPALLTRSATPTVPCAVSQQNDTLLMCQRISDSIKEFKKNAKRQLEQADDLKGQLKQLKKALMQQQQTSSMPHRINRTRVHRGPHPYLFNEQVPSYTPTISAAPTDYNHGEQAGVTAAPAGFFDNNEIFSASSQNYE